MNCPRCQAQNPENARFCRNCGTALAPTASTQRCDNCQMPLPDGAGFCVNCGYLVGHRKTIHQARLSRLAAVTPAALAEKMRSAAQLTGETKEVTALLVDVVGSAALAEEVGTEAWAAIINNASERWYAAIYHYEGTVARSAGDELLAFYGAPLAHEDDPQRAVHAALELLAGMRQYAAEVRERYGIEFAVRIGLSTGPVITGPVGGDLGYEYSALGGPINLAAQVESIQRPMTVLISPSTHRLVAPFFNCEALGTIEADGYPEPMPVYEVRGSRVQARHVTLSGAASPMVGRQAEMSALVEAYKAVQAGLGRAVLLVGEAGLGKTRLVNEWKATCAAEPTGLHVEWAKGRCLSYSRGLAYHLIADLVRSFLQLSYVSDQLEQGPALLSLIHTLFEASEEDSTSQPAVPSDIVVSAHLPQSENAQETFIYLAHLLALDLPDAALQRVQRLDPQMLRARYLAALQGLLSALASQRPLVLILENLHWADPSSIELLIQLLPLALAEPILFCLVTRPDREAPGWDVVAAAREVLGGALAEVQLGPLSDQESQQLVASLLGPDSLPAELETAILRRAEGNPLYVEEVVHMLVEEGILVEQEGRWVAHGAPQRVEIPDSLRGLLLARIDRLPDDAKYVLRVASVIGRQFAVPVLDLLLEESESTPPLRRCLSTLEFAGLIRVVQTTPELTCRFRSVLIHDAAYASILAGDRRRLHLAVARALERAHPDRVTTRELASTLAHHYYHSLASDEGLAEVKESTLTYLTLAGDAALSSYANQEAERHYRLALELAVQPPNSEATRSELLSNLGQALYRESRFEEAIDVWDQGIELYRELGNSDGLARLYANSARAAWYMGDPARGFEVCQRGLAAVAGLEESPGIAALMHEAGRAHFFSRTEPEKARGLCQQALQMAQRLNATAVQADVLATLGILPDQTPTEAAERLAQAIALAESSNLPFHAHRAHNNLATVLESLLLDLQGAQEHYRQAAELSRETGNVEGELIALSNGTNVSLRLGDFNGVERLCADIESLLPLSANPGPAAEGLQINRALLLRYRGQASQAADLMRTYKERIRSEGRSRNLPLLDNHLAEILIESAATARVEQGAGPALGLNWTEVESLVEEAFALSDPTSVDGKVWPCCLMSTVQACQGRFGEARARLEQARKLAQTRASAVDEAHLAWADARLAVAEGDWTGALRSFEGVARLHARVGMRWWWARALQEWAETHIARGEAADLDRARTLLRESLALFEDLGVPSYAVHIQERLQFVNAAIRAEMVQHQQVARELAAASRIQESFLPQAPPPIPGWQLSVTLEPAGETSGDFYDFIPLLNGRWGIVIADVADKGVGAALYMALSRTLIRTYAAEYHEQPELTLRVVNRRLLAETHCDMFVTVFYAVIDPFADTVTYCNAGHNPPYLFHPIQSSAAQPIPQEASPETLRRTGLPLGILEDTVWESTTVQMSPGDVIVLYTDGVTEAHNLQEELFGEERLLQAAQSNIHLPVSEIREALLEEVHNFVGAARKSDDLTLMVMGRSSS